jgi:hypothetical protein
MVADAVWPNRSACARSLVTGRITGSWAPADGSVDVSKTPRKMLRLPRFSLQREQGALERQTGTNRTPAESDRGSSVADLLDRLKEIADSWRSGN